MSRFPGLVTLLATLAILAILSLALVWPLFTLATSHRQLYAILCGAALLLILGARLLGRLARRKP